MGDHFAVELHTPDPRFSLARNKLRLGQFDRAGYQYPYAPAKSWARMSAQYLLTASSGAVAPDDAVALGAVLAPDAPCGVVEMSR